MTFQKSLGFYFAFAQNFSRQNQTETARNPGRRETNFRLERPAIIKKHRSRRLTPGIGAGAETKKDKSYFEAAAATPAMPKSLDMSVSFISSFT